MYLVVIQKWGGVDIVTQGQKKKKKKTETDKTKEGLGM